MEAALKYNTKEAKEMTCVLGEGPALELDGREHVSLSAGHQDLETL
jgi:hypothetical protein